MGVILQVALPSRVLAAARLQCGAAGAGASRGLGVCAEHARLAARGESARATWISAIFSLGWARGATRSVSERLNQHRRMPLTLTLAYYGSPPRCMCMTTTL